MITELINISIGELWDKYTILCIKKEKIKNKEKLTKINTEISILNKNIDKYNCLNDELFIKLKDVNLQLWDIEDKLRIKELNKTFDNEFINLARNVYIKNDLRYEYKNEINKKYNSTIQEIKDYIKYN